MNLQIFAHAFDILDVGDIDTYYSVFSLEKQGIVVVDVGDEGRGLCCYGSLLQVVLFFDLVGRPLHVFESVRRA